MTDVKKKLYLLMKVSLGAKQETSQWYSVFGIFCATSVNPSVTFAF